jgi:transposase
MRYELADHEWGAIKPMLPNKPRGVPRVNDRVHQHGGVHHKEPAAVDGTVTGRVDQQDSCAQQTALA